MYKKLPAKLHKGFTLVELLIVIALIGILSVAVLATINPIEQTNKARDAKFKNDAAEVLSAYERYYAANSGYPFSVVSGGTIASSTDTTFGVGTETTPGLLITTSELKSSFAAKEPFVSGATLENKLYVYNNGSDANYVCYVPKATANRTRYGSLYCINPSGGANKFNQVGSGTCTAIANGAGSWANGPYLSSTEAYFMCVPESATVAGVTPGAGGTPTVAPTATPTP